MATNDTINYVPFPRETQAFLDKVYGAHGLRSDQTKEKLGVLRREFNLGSMVVAATGGINSEEELLRALEFYVLQSKGFLNESEDFLDEE